MKKYILFNLLAFVAMVTVNYLSNSLPLNGRTPGELSDLYPNLFVPAGLTFAIWGIIYLLLTIWIAIQAPDLVSGTKRSANGVASVGWLFPLSCVLNISWLFAWHWEQIGLSIIVMIGLLWVLVQINQRLYEGQTPGRKLPQAAFGIYQGWITVALIANVTALLTSISWNGFGLSDSFWAITMIGIGALLAVYMISSRNLVFHGVAVAWAFLGIFIKRGELNDAPTVQYGALLAMIAVLLAAASRFKKWWSLS